MDCFSGDGAGKSHTQVEIRAATVHDAEGVVACLEASFSPYKASYTASGYQDTVLNSELFCRRLDEMLIFVAAAANENIIGTIACQKLLAGEGHLRGMAVLPEWQGRGIADQLVQQAEHALRQQGCSRISLDTTEPLKRAMHFYERNGFRRSGKIADFFGMPLIEFVKEL